MKIVLPYFGILMVCLTAMIYGSKREMLKKGKAYIIVLFLSTLLGGTMAVWEQYAATGIRGESGVTRNPAGEGEYNAYYEVEAEGILEKYPMEIAVAERNMTGQEIQQMFEQAAKELEEKILGKNESAENVMTDLFLPQVLQEGLVTVSCTFDNYKIIDTDGSILQDNIKEDSYLIKVTAEFSSQDQEGIHEFFLRVVPKELNEQEELVKKISEELEMENNRVGQDLIKLPEQVNGYEVAWYPVKDELHWKIFCLGIMIMILLYLYEKRQQEQMLKEREIQLAMDYPDIVSQLSLLIGAGMMIGSAWEKIAVRYKNRKDFEKNICRVGYEEMLQTLHEMQDGVGEIKAYERFGIRCGQPIYRKLSSLLIQNVRKGTKGLQKQLDAEAREAFTQRKLLAKKLGEEAGTKLLIPMGLMLVLVFIILMVPAALSLQL